MLPCLLPLLSYRSSLLLLRPSLRPALLLLNSRRERSSFQRDPIPQHCRVLKKLYFSIFLVLVQQQRLLQLCSRRYRSSLSIATLLAILNLHPTQQRPPLHHHAPHLALWPTALRMSLHHLIPYSLVLITLLLQPRIVLEILLQTFQRLLDLALALRQIDRTLQLHTPSLPCLLPAHHRLLQH